MIRLFSALFPSEEAREHLVRAVRPLKDDGLRWVDPDNWHITLDFFGDQPNDAAEAREMLRGIEGSPVTMSISGAGSFDKKVLWAGVHGRVTHLMLEPSRPHLTLARAGRRTRDPWLIPDAVHALSVYRGPEFEVSTISLVQSFLGEGRGGGPRYEVIDEFPLR